MRLRQSFALFACVAAVLGGCAGRPFPPPPRSVSQLERDRQRRPGYPRHTVALHNLQRVLDPSLSVSARLESVKVIDAVGVEDDQMLGQLAGLVREDKTPEPLRRAVLDMLISRDYPGLASHVVDILPNLEPTSPMRQNVLSWLARNGQPGTVAEVTKAWARHGQVDEETENRYRQVVGQLAKVPWDEALLAGLNDDSFMAKGSALEILAERIHPTQLRERLSRMPANSQAVSAIQAFLAHFDYLPRTADQLIAVAQLHLARREQIPAAGKLCRSWKQRDGYVFRIQDFHLLSHLAGDPLREDIRRDQLMLDLGQATRKRTHVSHQPAQRGKPAQNTFWKVTRQLSTADIWTLYLLNEMLSNRSNQMKLYLAARDDWNDTQQVYGGLIRYVHGRATTGDGGPGGAITYRYPNQADGRNDEFYIPDDQAIRDSRDSLCWFFPNFQKQENAERTGPDPKLLEMAVQHGMRGLVLTSLDRNRFAAHFFNPSGQVVSLGVFPFRR